jgi:hypothetical protein
MYIIYSEHDDVVRHFEKELLGEFEDVEDYIFRIIKICGGLIFPNRPQTMSCIIFKNALHLYPTLRNCALPNSMDEAQTLIEEHRYYRIPIERPEYRTLLLNPAVKPIIEPKKPSSGHDIVPLP